MKKAMISQPMGDRTYEEIQAVRQEAVDKLTKMGYDVVDTYFDHLWEKRDYLVEIRNKPLYFLSKCLEKMAQCDMVFFVKGWKDARGCRVEHEAAFNYGIEIMYD